MLQSMECHPLNQLILLSYKLIKFAQFLKYKNYPLHPPSEHFSITVLRLLRLSYKVFQEL